MAYSGQTKSAKRIAIVAPARRLDPEVRNRLEALLVSRDDLSTCTLLFDPQCTLSHGHFAGDDAARTDAFIGVANDPDIDAVWFARGGYGSFRLLPSALERLEKPAWQKTYLGYSDIGVLLGALYKAGVGRVAHGPVANDIMRDDGEGAVYRALSWLATGDATALAESVKSSVPKAAFNITVLAGMCGTPWMPDLSGHILYLEDVGEYLYRIDRAIGQIMSQPFASRLAGIKLGRVSNIPKNDIDFGQTEEEITAHWCAHAGVPYLGRADIGHDADNKIVIFGCGG